MKWILIYWILTQVGVVSQTAEFNDEKSCNATLTLIVQDWNAPRNAAGVPYGQAGGVCMGKGEIPVVIPAPVPVP